MNRERAYERGVSLVELLVALAILAIALTPLLGIFVHALKVAEKSNKMTLANNLARDLAEEIRSKAFWDPEIATNEYWTEFFYPVVPAVSQSPQPFGLEKSGNPAVSGIDFATAFDGYDTSKARGPTLDDIDDYNHWCRGVNCTECEGVTSAFDGLCVDDSPLEDYDGSKYDGTGGLPILRNFTRRVEVFNIYSNAETLGLGHEMTVGVKRSGTDWVDNTDKFLFYDLRESEFQNYTSDSTKGTATGNTPLKVVRVRVEYNGPTVPDLHVEDVSLVVMSTSN